MSQTIKDLMRSPVVTVSPDATLTEIRELFSHGLFHHLIVVEEDKMMGVISDSDVLRYVSPFIGTINERTMDSGTLNKKAHQIMIREVCSVKTTDSIEYAASLITNKKVSCLPVLDENDKVCGIVSWKDLYNFLFHFFRHYTTKEHQ